jgi:hypothetical protein
VRRPDQGAEFRFSVVESQGMIVLGDQNGQAGVSAWCAADDQLLFAQNFIDGSVEAFDAVGTNPEGAENAERFNLNFRAPGSDRRSAGSRSSRPRPFGAIAPGLGRGRAFLRHTARGARRSLKFPAHGQPVRLEWRSKVRRCYSGCRTGNSFAT